MSIGWLVPMSKIINPSFPGLFYSVLCFCILGEHLAFHVINNKPATLKIYTLYEIFANIIVMYFILKYYSKGNLDNRL